jgi:hypothetical protein
MTKNTPKLPTVSKRDRRGGINLSDPHNLKILTARERERWLADHPRRTAADYNRLLRTYKGGAEIVAWRKAKAEAYYREMEQAWLRENPGEAPLPENWCVLERPFKGHKRWAAKVLRWIDNYEKR